MHDATRILAICGAALGLTLVGCGDDDHHPSSAETDAHSAVDGHDHDAGADHAEHADDDDDGDDGDHDDHAHGDPSGSLGSLTIGGATLEIAIKGDIEPGAEVFVDMVHTAGPAPAVVRVWIGVESGIGSLKSKASGHDNHFHTKAEVPAEIDAEAALWLEVQTDSGERLTGSLPLE